MKKAWSLYSLYALLCAALRCVALDCDIGIAVIFC